MQGAITKIRSDIPSTSEREGDSLYVQLSETGQLLEQQEQVLEMTRVHLSQNEVVGTRLKEYIAEEYNPESASNIAEDVALFVQKASEGG